ncbi:MAG: DUF2065 domain-containing protein [Nitrospinae bacterium]|nr:DUF2065 domain-containing protein [Nitrospinota bacterium]
MSFFLTVIGMVLIVEGVPYFCFPASVKALAVKLIEMDEKMLRGMGFLLTIAGLVFVYIGRRVII